MGSDRACLSIHRDSTMKANLGECVLNAPWKAVEKTDMAILFCGGDTSAGLSKETKEPDFTEELYWLKQLKAKGIPTILLINKTDIRKDSQALAIKVRESFGDTPVLISAKEKTGIEQIRRTILEKLPPDFGQQSITGTLVAENDLVLLVMPQDIQAPKGRLILPQVQTIRELLDKKCLIVTCTTDKLPGNITRPCSSSQIVNYGFAGFQNSLRAKTGREQTYVLFCAFRRI